MKNKKTVITITSIVAVLLVIIGVTYAYWLVTKTQTNQNIISSGCLDISLTGEKNDIELQDQFPLSDEDGMKLVPYEFTVTNNCTTSVDYQVNLETLGSEDNTIIPSAIKVSLNNDVALLSEKGEATPTLSDAYTARKLLYGTLAGKSDETTEDEVTYNLRLWIDADAPISEQNKTFTSKITVTVGQGVFNPYQEGTLAYSILENYGGAENIEEIKKGWFPYFNNRETVPFFNNAASGIWLSSDYDFNKDTGNFKLSGEVLFTTTGEECLAAPDKCKYSFNSNNLDYESQFMLYKLSDFEKIDDMIFALKEEGYAYNMDVAEGNGLDLANLYKDFDDIGTSYFFRGISNNFVKFGKYYDESKKGAFFYLGYEENVLSSFSTLAECEAYKESEIANGAPAEDIGCVENNGEMEMLWRIVRINGDGTIRLIYSGDVEITSTISVSQIAYNNEFNNIGYVGFTNTVSGSQSDSTIKAYLDEWYNEKLKSEYGKYIADGIFCNDRTLGSVSGNIQHFAAYDRLSNFKPQLTCTNKADRYTISSDLGNGLLTNPIGLITADEMMLSGNGEYSSIGQFVHFQSDSYWTMTPMQYDLSTQKAYNYTTPIGTVSGNVNSTAYYAVPVINLKADIKFTGNGSYDTPYVIVTE